MIRRMSLCSNPSFGFEYIWDIWEEKKKKENDDSESLSCMQFLQIKISWYASEIDYILELFL